MERTINLHIDGREVAVPEGSTILEAAKEAGIKIPNLCYHENLSPYGGCRVCLVEIEGRPRYEPSCVAKAENGMKVKTNTSDLRETRKTIVELLLANHPEECLTCDKNQVCELRKLAFDIGVDLIHFQKTKTLRETLDESSFSIVRDPNKCILCGKCVRACSEIQGIGVIEFVNRGIETKISPAYERGMGEVECVNCGQCIMVCPTGALTERSSIEEVWNAIDDPDKFVVVQTAPAVRAAIGEEFDMQAGQTTTGKMAASLRRLGFDRVFDTQFTADLTIVEEASELVHRVKTGGVLPMITSCSPGWIKFIEHFYPELLHHLSTCKSPQQMFGAVAKSYYAKKIGIDPEKMYVVSIMPCTAKKFESEREEMYSTGTQDVDAVLTTRELARMIKQAGIDFKNIKEEEFDNPLGVSTGAGTIFGATGGVMEAALRTAYEVVTGKTLEKLDFEAVRGMEGIRKASVDLNGLTVNVAVAHTLSKARILLDEIKEGKANYHFIEIMTCPGGCLGGGGQPIPTTNEIRRKRAEAIYNEDKGMPLRKSHENPIVQTLYKEFLEEPLSETCHHYIHTHYIERGK